MQMPNRQIVKIYFLLFSTLIFTISSAQEGTKKQRLDDRVKAFLEENKQKLAETQARIATLEEEGRRNSYR